MKKILATALVALSPILAPTLASAEEMDNGTAITIYSKAQPGSIDPSIYRPIAGQENYNYNVPGYAVVRSVRDVTLPKERTILKYKDVAAKLDPTTVQFRSLTDPAGTKVAEQSYKFDLVSQKKLLQKYIDREVSIERNLGDAIELVTGTLMSTQGGLTIKDQDGQIVTINSYSSVKFSELPGGLITKPTLVWDIYAKQTGIHKTEVSYQTEGITWWADYNLTFKPGKDANSGTIDFGSWVSILNQSGGSYNNAKLKLMAGDVQRVQPPQTMRYKSAPRMEMAMDSAGSAPSFAEKAFFEYHLYTLSRPASIPDNSTKQLELIPMAADVPVEKLVVYEGSQGFYGGYNTNQSFGNTGKKKVDVYLKFANKKENGMGEALPAGRIRVNQRDDDGSLEFIGENVIDHTARNEEVLIKLGSAFDVVGERVQADFFIDKTRKIIEEEFEIKLRNQKKDKVQVLVKENLYRAANWEIITADHKYDRKNANTIHFKVDIEPEEEKIVKYKVRYNW